MDICPIFDFGIPPPKTNQEVEIVCIKLVLANLTIHVSFSDYDFPDQLHRSQPQKYGFMGWGFSLFEFVSRIFPSKLS